jgi:hypothetical protein
MPLCLLPIYHFSLMGFTNSYYLNIFNGFETRVRLSFAADFRAQRGRRKN